MKPMNKTLKWTLIAVATLSACVCYGAVAGVTPEQVQGLFSGAISQQITHYVTVLTVALWVMTGKIKNAIKEQCASIITSVENLSVRVSKVEEQIPSIKAAETKKEIL